MLDLPTQHTTRLDHLSWFGDDAHTSLDITLVSEAARQETLRTYALLDSPPEHDFDALVELATKLCHARGAMLVFFDEHRLFIKAQHELGLEHLPRHDAVSALFPSPHGRALALHHLSLELLAFAQPLTEAPYHLRTLAACPIHAHDGELIGALLVGFSHDLELDESEQSGLLTLRRQIEALLEQRRMRALIDTQQRAISTLIAQHEKLLSTISHDTRNLLSGMLTNCEFALQQLHADPIEAREAIEDALDAARQAQHMLHEVERAKDDFRNKKQQLR